MTRVQPPPIELGALLERKRNTLVAFSLKCPDNSVNWTWSLSKHQLAVIQNHQELICKLRREVDNDGDLDRELSGEVDATIDALQMQPQTLSEHRQRARAADGRALYAANELLVCPPELWTDDSCRTKKHSVASKAESQLESWQIVRKVRAEFGALAFLRQEEYVNILAAMFLYNAVVINLLQPLYRISLSKPIVGRRWQKPRLNELFTNSKEMAIHISHSLIISFNEFLKHDF